MNILLFSLSIMLLVASVRLQCRAVYLDQFVDKFLGALLLAAANIVGVTILLSEFSAITPTGYLATQTAVAFLSWVLCHRIEQKSEGLVCSIQTLLEDFRPLRTVLHFAIVALLITVILSTLTNLYLAVSVPPNNYDSMTYHLSRVGYWLQNNTLRHYYTLELRQLFNPPNAEVLILWPIIFLRSDLLANLVQWVAYCGTGVAVFGLARVLRFSAWPSLFASLVYMTLPMVVLQSSSTQNDLVVTFFTASFFYFLHTGFQERTNCRLILSGIAGGLALGTKGTIFYIAPALALASLILAFYSRISIMFYIRWVVYVIVGFVCFGAYNYCLNYSTSFGDPIGPPGMAKSHIAPKLERGIGNMIRYGYKAAEFRGLPKAVSEPLERFKVSVGERYLSNSFIGERNGILFTLHPLAYYHEDHGWFGVLGFFVGIPVWFWYFSRFLFSGRGLEKWVYSIIPASFFLFFCFAVHYTPYKGRYFVLPLAFLVPLFGGVFGERNSRVRSTAVVLISIIAGLTLTNVTLRNERKPLLPAKSVFDANYYQKRVKWGDALQMVSFARFMEEVTEPGASIGYVLGRNTWDYLFFGRDFSRRILAIRPEEFAQNSGSNLGDPLVSGAEQEVMNRYGLDYLFVANTEPNLSKVSDPVFSHNKRNRYIRIMSRESWESVIERSLYSRGPDRGENISALLEIFQGAINDNAPLAILKSFEQRESFVEGDVG